MLSIIVPIWNEDDRITDAFLKIKGVLDRLKDKYEIIFIDDGSSDDTFEILRSLYQSHRNIKVIRLEQNFGQHCALLAGFEQAKGEVIITMDADAKVDPQHIPELLERIKDGYDIVVAWRKKRPGLGLIRRLGSLLVNHYTNIITGKRLHDHACSLKGYSGRLIKENLCRIELRRFFSIMIAKYAKRVGEIEVECIPKHRLESSLGLTKLTLLALHFITNSIKKNKEYRSYKIKEVLN